MKSLGKACLNYALLLAICTTSACSLYTKDRCYVEDEDYGLARIIYLESGSLELVELRLESFEWRRCAINEAIYRLTKEFEIIDE